jgi:hypothetical protein
LIVAVFGKGEKGEDGMSRRGSDRVLGKGKYRGYFPIFLLFTLYTYVVPQRRLGICCLYSENGDSIQRPAVAIRVLVLARELAVRIPSGAHSDRASQACRRPYHTRTKFIYRIFPAERSETLKERSCVPQISWSGERGN